MKPRNYKLPIITALFLTLIQVTCIMVGAPVRKTSDSEKLVVLNRVPEIIKRDEIGSFSLKTSPGNICLGTIIYDTFGREEIKAIDLPELIADGDGICQWDWKVPSDAMEGTAVFRASIEQNGIHDSISPHSFCIEKCPWLVPTSQP